MRGFLLGLLVAALGFGAYFYWSTTHKNDGAPAPSVHADAGAPPVVKKRRRRNRGAARVTVAKAESAPASGSTTPKPSRERLAPEPEPDPPEPVRLSAADLKIVGQGDDLSKPDIVHLDMSNDKEAPELAQDDIDARYRPQEDSVLSCISSSRPDPESFIPGRVTVKFRIRRTGDVRGVRVDAPAVLQKGGIYNCIKNAVGRLRFPASGSSQVVTYPYSLS